MVITIHRCLTLIPFLKITFWGKITDKTKQQRAVKKLVEKSYSLNNKKEC